MWSNVKYFTFLALGRNTCKFLEFKSSLTLINFIKVTKCYQLLYAHGAQRLGPRASTEYAKVLMDLTYFSPLSVLAS